MQQSERQQHRPEVVPLEVDRVSRNFGGLQAVDHVSFSLHAGERLAVLGPNGAGKSTLFNLVCGDVTVDSGHVVLRGEDVTTLPLHQRIRRGLARTYQTSSVFADLTVCDHLVLAQRGPHPGRLSAVRNWHERDRLTERARGYAERVSLAGRFDDIAGRLSHGELRQLEIAMALAADPTIILLDEPAAGLSLAERRELTELLLQLDETIAVVLVEHDMDVALTVAERVIVLESGRIIAEGTPAQIENDPIVLATYLGEQHGTRSHG